RASRNALKHGLNVSIRHEPGASEKIEHLAAAIACDGPTPQRMQAARDIAEVYLELRRVQQYKLTLIESEATKLHATATDDHGADPTEQVTYKYAQAYLQALSALSKVERYERRVLSRHRRANRAYLIAAGE
ncbi:MAG TPA: hypothetical protein VKE53_07740, partial [Pseudolabrys sp.]|nr:hypothetical protein [Pseudolabrys sp.]